MLTEHREQLLDQRNELQEVLETSVEVQVKSLITKLLLEAQEAQQAEAPLQDRFVKHRLEVQEVQKVRQPQEIEEDNKNSF